MSIGAAGLDARQDRRRFLRGMELLAETSWPLSWPVVLLFRQLVR